MDSVFDSSFISAQAAEKVTSVAANGTLPPLEADGDGSVGILEVVRIAMDSLQANKFRAILTMLGVIIGVASVVALLALGSGASASITGQIESIGTNLLTVLPGAQAMRAPGAASAQTLTMDDYEAIRALGLPVAGIAPQFGGSTQLVAAAADKGAQVVGTTAAYRGLNDLQLQEGVFFDEAQERAGAAVVVLGANLAEDLFGGGQAVGQTVRVKGQVLRVIGVLAPEGGNGFGSVDDQAFVPIRLAQERLFGGRTPDGNSYRVSSISLSATDSADLDAIQSRVEALLRERHHLATDGEEDDFTVFNQASLLGTLSTITSLLTAFLGAIAGISLLVGGIGIMNIMLVSVTERTREIGLRKAVGATAGNVLLQFVVEAVFISLLGGVIGVIFGVVIALLVGLSGALPAAISAGSILLALGFSVAVGLFFGIYPARRAARLNPIDALRYE
jgi:putative ABC transport system permease protein